MIQRIITYAIFIGIGVVLISNQALFLFGGDSAEYSTAAATFSIPHPPGYPFYTLLGNIITRVIPFGTIPWKLAFLSSIPSLITTILIYRIVSELTRKRFIPIIVSLFYILLFPVWLYSEVPEVFAINNLLIILITYLILKFNRSQLDKYKLCIFLLIGLSIAHHHTFILFLPGWYFLLKSQYRKKLLVHKWYQNILMVITGSIFYIYPLIASRFNPPIDWENSRTLMGLIRLITRSSYGSFSAYAGATPNISNQLYDFFSLFIFILQDFRILGTLLAVLGFIYLARKKGNFFNFLSVTTIMLFFFLFYSNFYLKSSLIIATFERYFIFIYLIVIFYFAYGLIVLETIFKRLITHIRNTSLKSIVRYSFYVFLSLFILILFKSNYASLKYIKNMNHFEYLAYDILNTVPRNSILYVSGDIPYFTTQYVYSVWKYRNDIKLIFVSLLSRDYYAQKVRQTYPDVYIPTNLISTSAFYKEFLEKNSQKFPIIFDKPIQYGFWQPYGLLWKYYPTQETAKNGTEQLIRDNEKMWQKYRLPKLNSQQNSILFLSHLRELYGKQLINYINLLSVNNENNKIDSLFSKKGWLLTENEYTDIKIQVALRKKDCGYLQGFYYLIADKKPFELSASQLENIIKYYGTCDKDNNKVYEYLYMYRKYKR